MRPLISATPNTPKMPAASAALRPRSRNSGTVLAVSPYKAETTSASPMLQTQKLRLFTAWRQGMPSIGAVGWPGIVAAAVTLAAVGRLSVGSLRQAVDSQNTPTSAPSVA